MNFDRVAGIYDATRGLPDSALATITETIVTATAAGPHTRFLELGVGTGRIALPMLRFGFPYTGIDISQDMMERLKAAAPADAGNLTLVMGDVTDLPFGDAAFDVVLTVHVLHLIPEWRTVLQEIQRVLTPEGCYVNGGNRHLPGSPDGEIRAQWHTIALELDAPLHLRHVEYEEIEATLIESGARLAEFRAARWESQVVPADLIERIHQRSFSQSWDVPEPIMDAANERLLTWARERYGDITHPLTTANEFSFLLARWPEERSDSTDRREGVQRHE
jgi:ubiquinone/menaquinone biosynthesis C-methylase UbiE